MIKILAFGGSSSRNSINKTFAVYTAGLFSDSKVEVLDLNDFEMPLFSVDKEKETGFPDKAHIFLDKIKSHDLIVLSLAEHNGAYSTAFKNILDWASRIEGKIWQEKAMLLMATSPGGRGGATVLEMATKKFPFMGADIKATFSLPLFNQNFDYEKKQFLNEELHNSLKKVVSEISDLL
ncbi:MAG: NAD(P)H-dependent oxidoreductase [Saprospiraceae bacterium]|nr:NAD(P)H-dependent oxidoreductase [Saprospiraceae bacterium]